MTRPQIIRADSIDLQDQTSPSAQDHSRHMQSIGPGPRAPHQAEALRELAVELAEENQRSPRVSREWAGSDAQQLTKFGENLAISATSRPSNTTDIQQRDDEGMVAHNGEVSSTSGGEDSDMADAEGEDCLDDDMMDKISSSPSIDDGGYTLPPLWPKRSTSLERTPVRTPSSSQACDESSSPYVETPDYFPLRPLRPGLSDKDAGRSAERKENTSRHFLLPPDEYPDATGDGEPPAEHASVQQDVRVVSATALVQSDHEEHVFDRQVAAAVEENQLTTGDTSAPGERAKNQSEDEDQLRCHNQPAASISRGYYGQEESEDWIDFVASKQTAESMTIPYESSEDEDENYHIPYAAESRFVDSGWGGDCLQELEDIDFEFVYALHTFIATVEGQANATKGDTMVLLDDSNSYWWLVRVVKDSSIGYLPAEHIETPTERLARLNKYRNIDLTSTMLGDQAEKIKNPLKKALRKRNTKTVVFTSPTYYPASDIDYSTDEEDIDRDYERSLQDQIVSKQEKTDDDDETATVAPLRTRAEGKDGNSDSGEHDSGRGELSITSLDGVRTSEEIFDGKSEPKSRNGTLRNTDSFFRDDSVETRKITLTPNLLRDDSSPTARISNETKDLKRASLDKLEKDPLVKDKDKKDRKEKKEREKKSGMLSGFFKRKDKKSKSIDEDIEDILGIKLSTDGSRNSPASSKDSDEILMAVVGEELTSAQLQETQKHTTGSKLQKQERTDGSPVGKSGQVIESKILDPAPVLDRPPMTDSALAPSMRLVQPDASAEAPTVQRRSLERSANNTAAGVKELRSGNAISKILRTGSSNESRPVKAKKAKSRVELDDFDSSTENSPVEERIRDATIKTSSSQRLMATSPPEFDTATAPRTSELSQSAEQRPSESPVPVLSINDSSQQHQPPPLMIDTSSQEEAPSPASSPSPDLMSKEDAPGKKASRTSTPSTATSTWSDAHLRTFFDDDADIKDLLMVVYDRTGVVPAGPDHPITGNLFKEENAKLVDITNRLDGMLGDWLARKSRMHGAG